MASLHKDRRTGNWILMFRLEGRQFRRSCKTEHEGRARAVQTRVAEKLRLLELGDISIPVEADAAIWLMSDGKKKDRPGGPPVTSRSRFGVVCEQYLGDQIHKAPSTVSTEKGHMNRLKKFLRESTPISRIDRDLMDRYVRSRRNQKYRGKPISGTTIRKELVTFQQIWRWARRKGYVKTHCPIYDIDGKWSLPLPKPAERIKFQTWAQIERRIARGGVSEEEQKKLWSSLFLDSDQVAELLRYVKDNAKYSFVYPMFAFCAYTGARRSEILKSQIDDFDFETRTILIRERKRRRHLEQSTRLVPMHPELARIVRAWFKSHPGGIYTITAPLNMPHHKPRIELLPVSTHAGSHHFKRTLAHSKWSVLKGFHVLRHSFGANLARTGQFQMNQIGEWMGHSTQEMMEYYQHLFPQDGTDKIQLLKYL